MKKNKINTWEKTTPAGKQKKLEALQRGLVTCRENFKNRLLTISTEELGISARRKKVFNEQDERCNKCKIADWNGEPLTFELEHIDGNPENNVRENLEMLCPNCHAQTDTWRGRSKKRKHENYTKDQLLRAYVATGSIGKALTSLGIKPNGSNRKRMSDILITARVIQW